MEDSKIVALFWAREETAVAALAKKYGRRLYQTALNILGIAQDAQECVNDTYLALWNAIPPAKPDPLSAFVHRVGRNTALTRLRSNMAQKRNCAYDVSLEELAGCIGSDDIWEVLDARALGRAIDRFLNSQSQENRVIFLRRYWYGDSVKDIGKAMGMQENAVSVRLSRMRSKLKDFLIQEGFYDEI